MAFADARPFRPRARHSGSVFDAAAAAKHRPVIIKVIFGLLLFAFGASLTVVLDNYYLQVGTTLAMLCVLCWAWNLVGGYMGYNSPLRTALGTYKRKSGQRNDWKPIVAAP
jgi:hypothetical protein